MPGELLFNLLNPAIMAVFATVFGVLWIQRRREPYLLVLSVAFTCGALGFLLMALLLPPGTPEWRLLPNALFFTAVALLCSSALLRLGIAVPMAGYGFAAAFNLTGLWIFFFLYPSLLGRIYVSNASFALMLCMTLLRLRHARRWGGGDWLVGGLAFLALGLCITRPISASFEIAIVNAGDLRGSGYWLAIQFMTVMVAVLVGLAFLVATASDMFSELQAEAQRDPLSGLLNRGGFETLAQQYLAEPHDPQQPVAMLIADLDDFKVINDTFGHGAGDRVIAAVGQVLRGQNAVRCAGRIGGEEFALLYTGVDAVEARLLGEGLVAAIAELRVAELPPEYRVTLSAGLHVQRGTRNLTDLYTQADTALYAAKRGGKNRLVMSSDPLSPVPLHHPNAA